MLEINPKHALVSSLADKAKAGGAAGEVEDAAQLLLDQAYIMEGEPVADPTAFAERLTRLMGRALG